jgi:PKD repeat protein
MKKFSIILLSFVSLGSIEAAQQGSSGNFYEGSELQGVFQGVGGVINDVNSLIGGFNRDILNPIQKTLDTINDASYQINDISNTIHTIENNFDEVFENSRGEGVLPSGEFKLDPAEDFGQIGNSTHIREFIHKVLNFLLQFLGLLALVMVIYAGFRYLTSLGDDTAAENARKTIQHVVIGIIIVLMSFALVWTVINFVVDPEGLVEENQNNTENQIISQNFNQENVTENFSDLNFSSTSSQVSKIASNIAYQNAVYATGSGIADQGVTAYVPAETGAGGIKLGLRYPALAQFQFSDGSNQVLDTRSDISQNITKSFTQGKHTIFISAEDLAGNKKTLQKQLIVGGITADFSVVDRLILVGVPAQFISNATSIAGNITQYEWSCSGGSGCFPSQSGAQANPTFSSPGSYTVSLKITDAIGNVQTIQKQIQVILNQPKANFSIQSNQSISNPKEFKFDASGSSNILGSSEGLTYHWDLGETQRQTASPVMIYQYSTPGTKTVQLMVSEQIQGQTLGSEVFTKTLTVLP